MYFIPLILLIVFGALEIIGRDKKHYLFYGAFTFLTLAICLRYGQGTDYFGYMELFYYTNHGEFGYALLQDLVFLLGLPFEAMAMVIAAFQMACVFRFIVHHSPYRIFSLLLLYPTIYLTYFFSAIRQGIVIAFFLGFMVDWLLKNKWWKYLLACVVLSTFHSSALVLIPLIIVRMVKERYLWWGLVLALFVGVFICFAPAEWFSFIKIGAVQYHIQVHEFSPLGLAERTAMFFVITTLYRLYKDKVQIILKEHLTILYKVYFCSYIIAVVFFPWQLLSSRMGAAMKALEIILFPIFVYESRKLKYCISVVLVGYVLLMTTKNINSYINQRDYEGCNVLTYPYFSLWNKEEAQETDPEVWEKIVIKRNKKLQGNN